jgi:hypothetical protein
MLGAELVFEFALFVSAFEPPQAAKNNHSEAHITAKIVNLNNCISIFYVLLFNPVQ